MTVKGDRITNSAGDIQDDLGCFRWQGPEEDFLYL